MGTECGKLGFIQNDVHLHDTVIQTNNFKI